MPRRKKAAKSWAKKALKMHEVLKSRKRQSEEEKISVDCGDVDCNILPNRFCQDQCHQLSPKSTRVTNESIELDQPEIDEALLQHSISTVTSDRTVTFGNENQDEANSVQPEIDEPLPHSTPTTTSDRTVTFGDEYQDEGNSIQLNILSTSQETPRASIEGRRIINLEHFYSKIKEIADHGPLNCGLGCVEIVGERQLGLLSKFTLQCKLCNTKFFIESDSPDDLHVNHSAVAGIIAIGGGHWQLQELSAALNLPLMTPKIYQKSHAKLSAEFEKISIDSMNQAAKKERDIAIDEGRVDKNGIPIIDVIVDGCWSKRTYKKNYSAFSGAAAIIGKRTGEVLFLGIRNKYCCICAQAEKKKIEPKTHLCYKNYNGPSTGMESDILLEGFKCSIQMHGLIYGRMVSDGDSNTYAKLLKSRPYNHLTVEKIECRNHVLRNLCNKLVQLQTDTKYPLQFRKQLTQTKIMILRKTVRKIIKIYKTDSESERRCNIEPFYNDLLLAHLHAFGDHSRCKASFCTEINKSDLSSKATDKHFFTSTLWSRICMIMSNVASHAPSLIHDVDSNLVERFNSIVAKFVGGKRINFSMKGSYQTRCQAALVSFNSHKMMSSLYKSVQGRSPRGKIKLLEQRRLRKLVYMRKVNRKKNRLLFLKGNDANYGETCEKPDMQQEIFEKEKNTFLQNLNRSDEERDKIQKETVLQSSCSEWMEIRRTILTASNFGRVIKRREDVSCANIVKDILYKDSLSHVPSISHGKNNEKTAIEQLKLQENIDIHPCGLFIDKEIPFLGASPDGVVGDDMIVEIKCPITAFKDGIEEAIKSRKLTFYKLNKNGVAEVNKNHNWFFQIQGQLHIVNKSKCLLGIWYGETNPIKIEIIQRDDLFWEKEMKYKLKKFYLDCLLPELVDPRHSRSMQIRDPEYIEKAIKEKQKKNNTKKSKVTCKRKLNEDEKTQVEENEETTNNRGVQKINEKKRRIDNKENSQTNKSQNVVDREIKTNKRGGKLVVLNEICNEVNGKSKKKLSKYNTDQDDCNIALDQRKEISETDECLKDASKGLCGEDKFISEECDVEEEYGLLCPTDDLYGRQLNFTEF